MGRLLTGHFMRQGEQLTRDAGGDRRVQRPAAVARDASTASVNDLISLQNQLSTQVQQGLLPALGVAAGALSTASRPKSQEAYDLYLHSLALPHDPAPNKDAIAVLEHVVGVDPGYAPAWEALGQRYYYDSTYGGGGEADVPALECRV